MRNAFASEMTEITRHNEDVVLLSGDIGNKLFDPFKTVAANRFFNCGVAEANMIGAAAGMAMCGLRPVAYTIAPFITYRCFEQIRVDLCYHNLPVVVVGVGGGLSYASLGATHHSLEDIAALRVLPNMTVICPADQTEVRLALRAALKLDGPVYIRLGKKGEPAVHTEVPDFKIGRAITLNEGTDVCILATGNIVPTAMHCVDALAQSNISARLASFHTVKPLDQNLLQEVFEKFRLVVVLEEHSVLGGLGSAIAEWRLQRSGQTAQLMSIGTSDEFLHEAGNQRHARNVYGLTTEKIVPKVITALDLMEKR